MLTCQDVVEGESQRSAGLHVQPVCRADERLRYSPFLFQVVRKLRGRRKGNVAKRRKAGNAAGAVLSKEGRFTGGAEGDEEEKKAGHLTESSSNEPESLEWSIHRDH